MVGCLGIGSACGEPTTEPDGACGGRPCDVPADREELLERLEGFSDPMAAALMQLADDDATIGGGWQAVLAALGDATGCTAEHESAFVVLSNQALRPKGILTRCVDDPVQASRFFLILEPHAGDDDLDGEAFRVAAWDDDASAYRRYQMVPFDDSDRLAVSVEPEFCAGCHGGPARREPWVPIMNEMTEPWAQWNAEPGFASYAFDEAFPEGTRGPVFEEVASADRLDSASNLEPIVRAALSRVSTARIDARDEAPDLEVALDLLRPVFCDETVNFVSEIHDSGEINLDGIIDPGLRDAYASLGSWPWSWVTDINARVVPAEDGELPLALLAVRGHAVVAAESSLRSRGVLTPEQLLAVRALDWTHPFASPLRCGLFEDAHARVESGQTAIEPSTFADNQALVGALYDEAMRVDGTSLVTASADTVLAVADAADVDPTAIAANPAQYELDLTTLGEQIATHVQSLATGPGRAALLAERNRRGCIAAAAYPVTPLIPDLPECA